MLASCCDLDFEVIRNSFLLYKNVTSQYRDPRILSSVLELIPKNISKYDLVTLLKWFKSFMNWMPKQLVCNNCSAGKDSSDRTQFMEFKVLPGDSPNIRKIEVYTCNRCNAMYRFPRYNDVLEIAKTRTGRCSEWSILFGAILNSVSTDARIVQDYLDHCWNEVLLDGKWIHVDSTLDFPISLNHPYFYEQNWKKNYVYVLAFTSDRIEDVTQKYTEQWDDILARRQKLQIGGFKNPVLITDLENYYSNIAIPYKQK
jgi:peptide-N4-(N-acetyl-beta-glucosaminyl)asparagine amidase